MFAEGLKGTFLLEPESLQRLHPDLDSLMLLLVHVQLQAHSVVLFNDFIVSTTSQSCHHENVLGLPAMQS